MNNLGLSVASDFQQWEQEIHSLLEGGIECVHLVYLSALWRRGGLTRWSLKSHQGVYFKILINKEQTSCPINRTGKFNDPRNVEMAACGQNLGTFSRQDVAVPYPRSSMWLNGVHLHLKGIPWLAWCCLYGGGWEECHRLNVCPPSNSICCWHLNPRLMVLCSGAFGRTLSHEGGTPMNWNSALITRGWKKVLFSPYIWRYSGKTACVNQKTILTRLWFCPHLDLHFQLPEMWKVHFIYCSTTEFMVTISTTWYDACLEFIHFA